MSISFLSELCGKNSSPCKADSHLLPHQLGPVQFVYHSPILTINDWIHWQSPLSYPSPVKQTNPPKSIPIADAKDARIVEYMSTVPVIRDLRKVHSFVAVKKVRCPFLCRADTASFRPADFERKRRFIDRLTSLSPSLSAPDLLS